MPRKAPAPPPSLPVTVAAGERRKSLEALRDHLAVTIDLAAPENVAALAKQLREVLRELDELPVPEETNPADALARRRAARRRTAPEDPRGPGRRGVVVGSGGG